MRRSDPCPVRLPVPLRSLLLELALRDRSPLVLIGDARDRLVEWRGEPGGYGLPPCRRGMPVEEFGDVLFGLLPLPEAGFLFLPSIKQAEVRPFDLYALRRGERSYFLFLDASSREAELQPIQQQRVLAALAAEPRARIRENS